MASMLLGNCAALLASKGMQLFELDQMQGGGNPACYSTDPLHDGHPKGFGKWIYNGIVSTMQAVRDVRQGGAYPDFAMSMEDPGELYIPYLDCMLGRPNNVNAWPADSMANSLVVPAFEYVYSDLVPIQTADLSIGASFATGGDDPFNQEKSIVDLSRLYVAGGWLEFEIPPWLEYWRWAPPNNYAPLSSHTNSKHLAYIRNCTVSLANVALPFFDTGRMVSADGFSPPPYTYNEAVWDGSTNTCGGLSGFTCVPHTVSAVNHSAWKIGSTGPSALVLTNADMLHSSVLITLPTSYDGISYPPSTPCTVWRNGTSGGASTFGANATITLNQLDIVVVTF
jgi:hypothetical protein